MSDSSNPEVSPSARPDELSLSYDLERALSSVVGVRSTVPEDALTAAVLGTERAGHGVVVGEQGLVATIGYLVVEASDIWLMDGRGNGVPGHVVGYDQDSGFGVVQPLKELGAPAMELGRIGDLRTSDPVTVASHGGRSHALSARVIAKREFAGYWEYVLDEAVFTAPAHPSWGGAALIGADGKLYGVGSLLVQQASSGGQARSADCNMFVPVDLLEPLLEDYTTHGWLARPSRPWLGMFVYDVGEFLVVAGVYQNCPAHLADIRPGDVLLEVEGRRVTRLIDLFRSIWALGPAGVEVPLTVVRDGEQIELTAHTADRNAYFKGQTVH